MRRTFSYEVQVRANAKLAWEIFSNWRRWHTFANVYGKMEWTRGEPWTVGSRLSIEIIRPLHAMVDHVITFCDPGEKVGWIDHALGIAIDQWVVFEPRNGTGTQVRIAGEIVGTELVGTEWEMPEGLSLEKCVNDFIRQWFDNFAEVCNQLAPISSKASKRP